MNDKRINELQLVYIIPAALFSLWQACIGWLNTYWTLIKLGESYTTQNYVMFFLAHAIGIAVFAIWFDHSERDGSLTKMGLKATALFSAATTALLVAIMPYVSGQMLAMNGVLVGITASYFVAYFTRYIFQNIPVEHRGITIGVATALGLAVHFIVFTLLFPQQTGSILFGKTFFTAGVFLAMGITVLLLPVCRRNLWSEQPSLNTASAISLHHKEHIKPMRRIQILLFIVLLCFFISYGMQDFAATSHWMSGEGGLVFTRLFMIAGFIIAGYAWDKKGRHSILSSSFALLLLGVICMAFQYKGLASFVGFSGVQVAAALFSVATRMMYLDIARFYRNSVFVSSLGIVFPLILKQTGILLAGYSYIKFGGVAIFLGSLVFVVFAMPFISLTFERIREINVLGIRESTPVISLATNKDSDNYLDASVDIDSDSVDKKISTNETGSMIGSESKIKIELEKNTAEKIEMFARKHGFTKRETQVIELSMHGLAISDMAQNLNISEATIKHHVKKVLRKTGTANQKQLLSMFIIESGTGKEVHENTYAH